MTKNLNWANWRAAVIIATVSFAAILSLAVFAVAYDDCGSDGAGGNVGAEFDFEGMKYKVTSNDPGKNYVALVKGKDGAVVIPEFAKAGVINYKVTKIEDGAFENCNPVSVVMPDSIRIIGDEAFFTCNALNSVIMSKGLNSIGSFAFLGSRNLKSIDIPEGTTSIGKYAFDSCSSLDLIKIPASLSSIGKAAFGSISISAYFTVNEGNTKYKSVDGVLFNASMDTVIKGRDSDTFAIPSSVKTIACYAFAACNFTSVTIPAGATSIEEEAFADCPLLTSVSIPNSVTSIERAAFANCPLLTSINIPNGMTSIAQDLLSGSKSLESVNIPDSVTSIGYCAFGGCQLLKSVSIPDSVTSIGESAFSHTSLSSFHIPSKITSISDKTFFRCYSLKSITFPSGIKSIGKDAFYECTAMTNMAFIGAVMPTCGKEALNMGNITVSVLSKFPDPLLAPDVTGNTKFVFSKLENKYTVTINPPAAGGSVTPSAGTHYINAGDDLKITAKPSEGYSFKCFYVDTVMVSDLPEYTIKRILSNTSVSAEFEITPTTDVNCTVSYNADDGTALKPQKTVAGKVGSKITEQAPTIAGYVPDKQSKSLVLKTSGNEITFVYTPEASPAPAGDSSVLVIAAVAVVCLGAAGAAVWFFKFRKP